MLVLKRGIVKSPWKQGIHVAIVDFKSVLPWECQKKVWLLFDYKSHNLVINFDPDLYFCPSLIQLDSDMCLYCERSHKHKWCNNSFF